MITFKDMDMRRSLPAETSIIGFGPGPGRRLTRVLLALFVSFVLGGCSAARLGYDNGPSLALWWLDGYLDLNRSQEQRLKPPLADWFSWHRATQLPDYAQWLATWKARASGNVTGEEVCRWGEIARDRLATAVDRALPAAAELLPLVEPAQWQFLEKRFAERLAEQRQEFAAGTREEREAATLERSLERGESFYGPLNAAQKRLLAERLAAQPLEAEAWLGDRQARQRDLVQALRRAQQEADAARRTAAVKAAAQRFMRAPDGDYGVRQARWQQQGCELTATLHNSTTPAQRQHLKERLSAWEEDVRALAAAGAP